ncbi:MAG: hypothetical protein APF81_13105 [Desulfosporosinus sp. BRH_c37]|nr:MAG: hypothetical protein APF81_13105 [Desulfosporosinus sp. BRH_c37]
MFDQTLDPFDTCGCGDTGYLTTRIVPVDLIHGVGHIENVPIYHCRSKHCQEFTIPPIVARRIDDIAEEMESTQATEAVYTWIANGEQSLDPLQRTNDQNHLQAFTLQFSGREYADATVMLIVPGQAIFFQSTLEETEYYLLRYEEDSRTEGTWFSFLKFYYEERDLTYEDFLEWSEDGHLKEIGRVSLDEVEDALIDEFGEWD